MNLSDVKPNPALMSVLSKKVPSTTPSAFSKSPLSTKLP